MVWQSSLSYCINLFLTDFNNYVFYNWDTISKSKLRSKQSNIVRQKFVIKLTAYTRFCNKVFRLYRGGKQVDARTVYRVNTAAFGYKTYGNQHERPRYPCTTNYCTKLEAFYSRAYQGRSQRKYMFVINNSISLIYFLKEL